MKKSQTATEYIIVLAFLGILVTIILSAVFDIPTVFQNTQEIRAREYWLQAPVGIIAVQSTTSTTTLVVINNFRQSISVVNVSINGINHEFVNMTAEPISSGETGAYVSNMVFNDPWIYVVFNVSFASGHSYVFNGSQAFPVQ